ncbi:unnamed protein product [Soboliphyme baturini]|uniref:Uncharacterized protein n=1 Tax=Soboliphyme baturini TaxID=241478 RepID=A0A183J1D6_9BILA|nr:unnamed protein product [Soboliphyme baturini]
MMKYVVQSLRPNYGELNIVVAVGIRMMSRRTEGKGENELRPLLNSVPHIVDPANPLSLHCTSSSHIRHSRPGRRCSMPSPLDCDRAVDFAPSLTLGVKVDFFLELQGQEPLPRVVNYLGARLKPRWLFPAEFTSTV